MARVLVERGIVLEAVLVQTGSPAPLSQGASVWTKSLPDAMRRRLRYWRRQKSFYKPLKTRIWPAGAVNSATMLRLLKRLGPDYIIVGSGNILSPAIIETARCGVLNVHPALLPWIRGSGVVGHSIQQAVPVGATLHFIDAGIDTGAIIERRLLPIPAKDTALAQLQDEAGGLAAQLMGDWVENIVRTGQKPPATAQTTRFPLFKWPAIEVRRAQVELIKNGRPQELFEAWRDFSDGPPNWILPPELMEIPR